MTMKKIKTMKVYSKFRQKTNDCIIIPQIMMQGNWLSDLGFKPDDAFKIEGGKNKLILTKLQDN